ncbi:leucine-rich PPR motif-containing protein, mitochondrial-like [Scylla paramamosain]|uniref:leucine-rich PPR motif-containing protein, mitochondrial-like n=1 Tax=Scylla paramamosain TaxID=85552 RepID=UPI003083259E
MASLLRSGSVSSIFSGLKRVLTTRGPRYDSLTLHSGQGQPLCPTLARLLSAQRPVENVSTTSQASQGIDRALYRIDTDIRRTGRIYLRDVEDIFSEIKTLKHASSTQSLLLLRCCGSLVPEEHPEVRNKLVQDIWNTLQELGVPLDISHYNTLLRVYLENSHKFSPTEFLAQLEKNGVEPNRVTYQRLISRYCQEGDIEGATKILEFMKEKQLPVGENIFNALITGHARANDLESAWAVLDVMHSSGLEPTTDSYAALLIAHAEAGDAEGLSRTLRECEAAELTMHDHDLLEAVYSLATHGHHVLVAQVMDKLHRQPGYAQDAMNVIYRLVNAGCHETAHQIFSTMRVPYAGEGQPQAPTAGAFFIKHLVKSGTTPMIKVVEYCQDLKEKGLNPLALEQALNSALTNGRPEEALFLMRVMKEEGCSLRPHYFWPIFLHHGKSGDAQKLYDTAKHMLSFGIPVTIETLRHYILPALAAQGLLDTNGTIGGLKEAGVPVPFTVSGIVAFLLDTQEPVEAATLLSRYRVRVRSVLRRDLADSYMKSGQTAAIVTILGQMLNHSQDSANADRDDREAQKVTDEDGENIPREEGQQDIAALFLLDVAIQCQRNKRSEKLLALLQEMEQRGIGISMEGGDAVRKRLDPSVDAAILEALDKVCSGNLTFQPLPREPQEPYSQRSARELEQRLQELQNKNLPTHVVQTALLVAYIRGKEVENAETLRKKMEAENIPLGTGVYVLLVDMYVGAGELEKALTNLEELMAREPDVKLNHYKYLRLALLMAQQGRAQDVVKLVQHHVEQESSSGEDDTVLANQARRLLEYMTEHSALQSARQVLDLLLAHKVVTPSTLLFNPFVKAHLTNDDLESALGEFESICQTHRLTPLKQELTTRCINLEDGERLQKIMDLSIQVHGELNSLYDMVFAFVECGKVHQARKLVETPGLRAFNGKLDQKCKWLRDMGKIEELANLVSVTKDIFDIDRDMMYSNLLKAYMKKNDPDKALGVWTNMQEDNYQPSDNFLIELGQFLQASGRKVPFAIPQQEAAPKSEATPKSEAIPQKEATPQPAISVSESTPLEQFRQALKKNDWTAALDLKKQVEESGGHLTITACSDLVEGLIKAGKLNEATNTVLAMVSADTHPNPRVFKFLLLTLAGTGQVEPIQALERYITDHSLKRRLNYDNLLCTAYITAGRSEEVLDDLLKTVKDVPDTKLEELAQNFPRGGILGILEKHPNHLTQVLEIAELYAARGITSPANCVWMHLFSTGQHDQANEIYQKHLKTSTSLFMFRNIMNHAEKAGDAGLLASLMKVLENHPGLSNQAKGLVYNSWIGILCNRSQFEEGQQVLDSALQTLHLSDLSTRVLTRLKEGIEEAGKKFPYTISIKESGPLRQAAASSSSSSSSDSD